MQHIGQCLNPKLAEIIQGALQLKELNAKLFEYLPQHLRAHFSVGSFNQGCLVLVTDEPVWASQMRFHLPELRDTLRKNAGIYQLASIKINVSTDTLTQKKSAPPVFLPLSNNACETILSGSELCDYDPLKNALKRLAEHAKQRQQRN